MNTEYQNPQSSQKRDTLVIGGSVLCIVLILLVSLWKNMPQNKETPSIETLIAQNEAETPQVETITATVLANKISAGTAPTLVDIREELLYEISHIPDSLHIPATELGENIGLLSGVSDVVVIGTSLLPSETTAVYELLTSAGISNVRILAGGYETWESSFNHTVSYGDPTDFVDLSKVTFITPEEVRSKVEKNENLFFIDVRETQYYRQGHLENSINIPLEDIERDRKDIPGTGSTIVIFGYTPLDSFQGGTRLFDFGHYGTLTLDGGYDDIASFFRTHP